MWVMGGRGDRAWEASVRCSHQRTFLGGSHQDAAEYRAPYKMGEGRGVFLWEEGVHMWLALGRAAAGFQQTPSEVQTTLHTLKSPWAYSPWTYHPTPLMPGASPLTEGCVSLVEWGRWAHILQSTPDDQGVQDMAWEDGVPGPPSWLCKGHRPWKLQGRWPPGKQRPDYTVPGQGHFLRQPAGRKCTQPSRREWGSRAMTLIVSRFEVSYSRPSTGSAPHWDSDDGMPPARQNPGPGAVSRRGSEG